MSIARALPVFSIAFARTLPLALKQLAPHSPFRRGLIVTLSTVIIFGYFGLAGWTGYGATSHALSAASLWLIPVVLILCLILRLVQRMHG